MSRTVNGMRWDQAAFHHGAPDEPLLDDVEVADMELLVPPDAEEAVELEAPDEEEDEATEPEDEAPPLDDAATRAASTQMPPWQA